MMQIKRKWATVFVAILLVLSMTGCSLLDSLKTESTEVVTEEEVTVVDETGEETETETEKEGEEEEGKAPESEDGKKETTSNAGKVDDSKEKKLTGTFELQIFAGGYGSEAWEYAIDEFQKLNPDLKITAHLDPNVNTQMKTRWAKGNPPDFVFLEGTDIPAETWMKEGKLMDLSEIYNKGKVYGTNTSIKKQIKSGMTSTYGNTSKIYSMPVLLSTYGLWYDEAYFKKNGWTMPDNYTELTKFVEKTKGNTIIYPGKYSGYLVWGLLMPAVASEAVASNDLQYFYNVANATSGKVFTDKRFLKCMTKLETLAKAGAFNEASLSMDHIQSQSNWLKHVSPIIPNGLWLENEMASTTPSGFKMRFCPSALQDAKQKTCIIASAAGVGISTKGKNPEAAKAFLRFLYTDKIAIKFAEYCDVPPATRTDLSKAKISSTAKQVSTMLNSSKVKIVAKGSTTWGSVDSVINDCVNQIVAGKMTAKEACDKLSKAAAKKR